MSDSGSERLRAIKTFPSLVKYLRDELDWPIETEDFDDLTFSYEPEELGIDSSIAAKIEEIKQLRPLVSNQPWGIFFIKFEPKHLPVVALRRILGQLVFKKRTSAMHSERVSWQLNDLMFISAYGEGEQRQINLAHFSENRESGSLPTLKVLGWDDADRDLKIDYIRDEMQVKFRWPDDIRDIENWRSTWASVFTLRHREVITTSKMLAERLAELATVVRNRVNKVIMLEREDGPLSNLLKAFRVALVHDLTEDGFADMYAQTISYGLLSEKLMPKRSGGSSPSLGSLKIMNPFLGELLDDCRSIGRKHGLIDFDELGVGEVEDLLNDPNTKYDDILRDFDNRNPDEDPVIHFYEHFLREYDAKQRVQRGVFFTPKPVVSFIVRSIDEILRTKFALVDGLADTTTWSEMQRQHPDMNLPKNAVGSDPFVRILDPSTGTGTFLVEVIDVIHSTMIAKWQKQGYMLLELNKLWNDYVSNNLLPRLYGFEIMMAPYAIAHMKIGLKLLETGYRFQSKQRSLRRQFF
ncbi:N-6 DNA methylase [Chloroflexota bacterium]